MWNVPIDIRDFVFPLVRATNESGTYTYKELIGTGFLIGRFGVALTAAHVIDQLWENLPTNGVVLAMFLRPAGWEIHEVSLKQKHPTEDVGVIKVDGIDPRPYFFVDPMRHSFQERYYCLGYPKAVAREITRIRENAIEFPELIYTEGYIRRTISRELEHQMYRGTSFYELSEVVGEGNSGSPIIVNYGITSSRPIVIGIYIGEKAGENMNVSYAVRSESFFDWQPEDFGSTISGHCNLF